jgi:prepilin-type N-terminal cleavage/methylation domain-containing protein
MAVTHYATVSTSMIRKNKQTGFTIVELLIVIVVIAILASITIVAFRGIQGRARDAERSSDVSNLMKALETYKSLNGGYPSPTPTGPAGSFEQSTDTDGTFIEALKGSYFSNVPTDPINDASHLYRYYVYEVSSLSSYGCPTDKGRLMVLYIIGYENTQNMPSNDPAVVCTGRTWQGGGTTLFKTRYESA